MFERESCSCERGSLSTNFPGNSDFLNTSEWVVLSWKTDSDTFSGFSGSITCYYTRKLLRLRNLINLIA